MKHLLLALLCLPFLLFAQEEKKAPNLYEVIDITVKKGQGDALKATIKAHNAKYHAADGMYNAFLTYNVNGPLAGQYTWIMGPTSWTALDDRPGEGGHDDDWDNVDQFVESYNGPGYWSVSEKHSHVVEGATYSKSLLWVYDIKQGQGTRWAELVGKVKEVYEEKRPDENFLVIWNEFADTEKGWDAVINWGFNKLAWLDRDSPFAPDYEAVHGPGSWMNFLNEFRATVDGRVDWIREVVD